MVISVLGQGYEPDSVSAVGHQLVRCLASNDYHTFTGISAFASLLGVNGLSEHILSAKTRFESINIIVGVDQQGTSREALEALLKLEVNAYVFYQPARTIFHPKIYLFEGNDTTELIVGSSNLTTQGLFTNIEASLLISIDNGKQEDRETVMRVKEYFQGIFTYTDPNLRPLSEELIDRLAAAGIVPTEEERKGVFDKAEERKNKEVVDGLLTIFPKRELPQAPPEFRSPRKRKETSATAFPVSETATPMDDQTIRETFDPNKGELLWESGPLTDRDLNIPKGAKTNPTGSMLFKKGKTEGIDQRHYFRNEVFSALNWVRESKPNYAHLERARAGFRIIVDEEDYGKFDLQLTHNTRTDTRTYAQNNSMTQLSWGEAKQIIAKEENIGKSAKLYKAPFESTDYVLIIS